MKNASIALFFLGLALLAGCTTSRPTSKEWAVSAMGNGDALVAPIGRFANHGESSVESIKAPTLSALLFDDLLEGFEIDNVRFAEGEPTRQQVLIMPHVGEIALKEKRLFEAEKRKDGTTVWTTKTKVSYVDGYGVTASVLWTGGALMPLAEWKRYHFHVAEDGALMVHLKKKELVNFFYLFPIPFTDEIWIRYPAYQAKAAEEMSP